MKLFLIWVRFVLFVLLLFSVFFCSVRNRKPSFFEDSITRVDVPALLRKAPSLSLSEREGWDRRILLEKVLYRLESNGTSTIQVHQIIEVLEESESLKYYSFSHREGFEWVRYLEAYRMSPAKKKILAEIKTFSPFDNESVRLPLYKELRRKEIQFDSVEKGSILHIRYEIRKENPIEDGIIEGNIYLTSSYPVLKQKIVILVPEDIPLNFRVSGTTKPLEQWVQKIKKGKWQYYIVERDNLPVFSSVSGFDSSTGLSSGLSSELSTDSSFDPSIVSDVSEFGSFRQFPQIRFSSFSSWKEISERLHTWVFLSEGSLDRFNTLELRKNGLVKEQLKQRALEILSYVQKHSKETELWNSKKTRRPEPISKEKKSKELAKQEQWVRDIYHFVTSTQNIANTGIHLGLAGYSPHSPVQVLQAGHGDAKDKAFLLFSLLSSLGLSVDLAFTSENENLDFPMLSSLDRILVRLIVQNDEEEQKEKEKKEDREEKRKESKKEKEKEAKKIKKIKEIKKETRFLDPYSAIVRYRFLPEGLYGKKVLILSLIPSKTVPKTVSSKTVSSKIVSSKTVLVKTFDTAVIETIPMLKSSENVFSYRSESKILANGNLEYITRFAPQGLHEVLERSHMIQVLLSNPLQSLERNYRAIYEDLPNVRILDFFATSPLNLNQEFAYHVRFLLRDFLSLMATRTVTKTKDSTKIEQDRMYVDPELHYPLIFSEKEQKTNFRIPFQIKTENRLQYPKDWILEKIPKTVVLDMPQYSYRREFHIEDSGRVLYRRHFEVKVPISKQENDSLFREWAQKIQKEEKEFLVFLRSSKVLPSEVLPEMSLEKTTE